MLLVQKPSNFLLQLDI